MTASNLSKIKREINKVNFIIENFLVNMNKGEIESLEGLDKKVQKINAEILKLSKIDFETLRNQFEESLHKVKELKLFLSNQLETTAAEIKSMDKAATVSKHYSYAANDNP